MRLIAITCERFSMGVLSLEKTHCKGQSLS